MSLEGSVSGAAFAENMYALGWDEIHGVEARLVSTVGACALTWPDHDNMSADTTPSHRKVRAEEVAFMGQGVMFLSKEQ